MKNNFFKPHRLVFFQGGAEASQETPDRFTSTAEVTGEGNPDALAKQAVEAGEKAYRDALQGATWLEKDKDPARVLLALQYGFSKLKDPKAQQVFLRKVKNQIELEAAQAHAADNDYGKFVRAYELKGVGPESSEEAIVKAALKVVAPEVELIDELDQVLKDARRQEAHRNRERYVESLLKDPREVSRRAKLTRRYLGENHLDYRDAGIPLKNSTDFDNDVKLVRAVLEFQNQLGLPQKDIAEGQDGIVGKRVYKFALERGIARESYVARLRRFPEEVGRSTEQALNEFSAKARELIAQAKADEVIAILKDKFNNSPLFRALVKVYGGTLSPDQRALFLKQAATDLTKRLNTAPDMTAELMHRLIQSYLTPIAESPRYKDPDQAKWVANAVEESQALYASLNPSPEERGEETVARR